MYSSYYHKHIKTQVITSMFYHKQKHIYMVEIAYKHNYCTIL